jgi:hypothetical protein
VDPLIAKQILVIEGEEQAAVQEPDARQKAAEQLLELKAAIDAMEKLSEWELLTTEQDGFRGRARKLSQASGTQEQVRVIEELIRSAEGAIFRRDVAGLRGATEKLKRAYWEINYARDDFWKEQLAWLREETDFVDFPQAERLKEEGARALKRSDIRSLRTIVWDLYALLPTWQKGKLDERFDDAGLLSAH